MRKNPYIVLKIPDNSPDDAVDKAYAELKEQYSKDMYLEGDAGRTAAKNLTELEQAYSDLLELRNQRNNTQNYGSNLGEINELIKQNQLNEAQTKLDAITEHTGEWHYLQSIIYYKKNWYTESKKQLSMALQLEPNNAKYKEAYQRLESMTGSSYQQNMGRAPEAEYRNTNGGCCGDSESNCCLNLLVADCCCECMGGDLIPCC